MWNFQILFTIPFLLPHFFLPFLHQPKCRT